jgi:hypothetical protein
LAELFVIAKEPFAEASHPALKDVVLALRGFTLDDKTPCFDKMGVLKIPDGKDQQTVGIAVSSWKTELQSWVASVMGVPDPDAKRYTALDMVVTANTEDSSLGTRAWQPLRPLRSSTSSLTRTGSVKLPSREAMNRTATRAREKCRLRGDRCLSVARSTSSSSAL